MTTRKRSASFDAVEFKRKAQAQIYEEIKDLSPQEEIAYFRRAAEAGSLGDWWKTMKRSPVADPGGGVPRRIAAGGA